VLGRIFGKKRDEVIGGWRKLHNEELHNLCYHLDVVRGPSTPHDPESDAGGSLSSWQGHPSR
jgi:hypothetical protein